MMHWLFHLQTSGPVSFDGIKFRAGWPVALVALVLVLVVSASVFVYRRAALSGAGKVVLATFRILAASLLVFMLLRPIVKVSYQQESSRSVLVLVDRSASMTVRDTRKETGDLIESAIALGDMPPDDPALIRQIWSADAGQLPALMQQRNSGRTIAEKMRMDAAVASRSDLIDGALAHGGMALKEPARYFAFGDRVSPWKPGDATPDIGSDSTRIGDCVRQAVEQYGPSSVAGVVLLTDGANNAGASLADASQWLAEHRVPVFPVGVGLTEPDDLSLRGLMVPNVVFADDLVTLRVQVRGTGYEKRQTDLVVALDGSEVARKTVTLTGSTQLEELSFKADRGAGIKSLSVTITPLPGEATIENNTLVCSIRVSDSKIKVLCIEGSPRWEFRYLRAVLKRDPRVDVKFITTEGDPELASASKEQLARFPENDADAFAFDLVILGDVRATFFTPAQLDRLDRLVREQGGSLILLAGHKHAPTEYVDTPVAAMLPVWIEEGRWESIGDDVYPVITPAGSGSLITSLDPKASKNQTLWSNVKPLDKIAPLLGVKPGATVLAELSDSNERTSPYPLIAWQRYGAGKTMFVGTDCLWRLRERTGDKYHLRFWGQAVQFMSLSRLLGENDLVRIETDASRGAVGQPVQVFANVQTAEYEPARLPEFTVNVTRDTGDGTAEPIQLKLVPGAAGLYDGIFMPTAIGHYTLARGDGEEQSGSANDAMFVADTASPELMETAMQADALKKLAATTGGKFLSLRDLPALDAIVPNTPEVSLVRTEVELWDKTVFVAIFIALTAAEWAWRRKRQLA